MAGGRCLGRIAGNGIVWAGARLILPRGHGLWQGVVMPPVSGAMHGPACPDGVRPTTFPQASQECAELFWSQSGRAKNGAQSLERRAFAPHYGAAPHWANIPSGDDGKMVHTLTRRASKCSSGTGKLSPFRAPTYAWTASLMLVSAASWVSPWVTQPGKLGQPAIQKPSSPR